MSKEIFFRNNPDLIEKASKALQEFLEAEDILTNGKAMNEFINSLGYKNVRYVLINDHCNGAIVLFN